MSGNKNIENSTLAQLFNFVLFMTSLLLSINNCLDIRYKWAQVENNLENDIGILHDMVLILASLTVCYLTINSPFEKVKATSSMSLVTALETESLKTVIFYTSMLYASTTLVVEDPMLLFTKTFDFIDKEIDKIPLIDVNIDINELDKELLTDIGLHFITYTNLSKVIILFGSVIYFLVIIYDHPPTTIIKEDGMRNWRDSTIPRVVLLWIWAFNVASYFVYMAGDDIHGHRGTFFKNTETVFRSFDNLSGMQEALLHPKYQKLIQDIAVWLMLLATFYIIAFYKHYEYGAFCLLACVLQNVDKADGLLVDNIMFDTNLWLLISMSVIAVASGIRFLWDNKHEYEILLQVIPDVLYKLGNIFCIAALFFAFISIRYDWLDFDFQPAGISQVVADSIEDASQRIDSVVDTLSSVATVLDPCSHRQTIAAVEGTVSASDESSLEQVLIEARQKIRDQADFNTNICVGPSSPFNFQNLNETQCASLRAEFEFEKQALIHTFNDNAELEGLKDYDENQHADDEFFVDQACVNAKCTALTAITVAAVATSFIPFFSGASKAATMAARAAFRVFKIGRRLTKSLPRMLRKKRKIKKMASRIVALASATQKHAGFSEDLAVIYLPIAILGTAALSVIMFRRGVAHKKDPSPYQSLMYNSIGFRMITGLYGPLAIAEFAFYMVLRIMPEFINGILKELPDVFVVSVLDVNVGFESLKFAYLLSFVGATMVTVGAILFMFENSILMAVKALINGIAYVYKRLFGSGTQTGADTMDKGTKCKLFCYKLTLLLTNWNTAYFQPLVFASPGIYLIYRGIATNEKYLKVYYGSNDDVARANDEFLEVVLHKERSEGMFIDFDAMNCGAVAKLVKGILEAVPGGLPNINLGLSDFTNAISGAFDGAQEFLSELANLVDLDFINIDLPQLFPSVLIPWMIFGLPILAAISLVVLWLLSVFIDGFADLKNLLLLSDKEEYRTDTDSAFYGRVASAIAMFAFYISVINVLTHLVVGAILISALDVDMPFVKVTSEFGPAYFDTQYASLFTMMGAISIYVNVLLPVAR